VKEIFNRQNPLFPSPRIFWFAIRWLYCLELSESSGERISFTLWTPFHHGSPCSYVTWGMNNRPVGGSSSETYVLIQQHDQSTTLSSDYGSVCRYFMGAVRGWRDF
jgi:hypothetical protein